MKRISLILLALFFSAPVFAEEMLVWENCLSEAKQNNPGLISSYENLKQQKAQKEITASALYPQIIANADVTKSKNTVFYIQNYSYDVTGSQLIFDGLQTINQFRSAKENVNAAKEGYELSSATVRLNLRTAFVNLLQAQEMIGVAEEIISIRKSNLKLITLRYNSGLEHKGSLMTAEANLASAEFDLTQAKRSVETAQRQLTQAMGRKDFVPMTVRGDFSVKEDVKNKPDLESLTVSHPSILQAIAQKRSADLSLKSTYGTFSPQLSATAGAGMVSQDWPPSNSQLNVGLNLSTPILEGGLRSAQVQKAKAALRQADANERGTREQSLTTLEQAWAGLKNALDAVGVQEKTLSATEVRSKIADSEYSTGFITFDNWIIIEDDLVRAKRNYLLAKASSLIAEAQWIYSKGGTLEYEK